MNETFRVTGERLTQQYRHLDLLANNLANLSTPGFKATDSGCRGGEFSSWLRDKAGAFEVTENSLDLALPAGSYLQVETPQGVRLTRRGDLHLDEKKRLVVGEGFPVLSDTGSTLTVAQGPLSLDNSGGVWDGGRLLGKLGRLRCERVEGQGSWLQPAAGSAVAADSREVLVGQLESSNLEVAEQQTHLVAIIHRASALGQLLQVHDQTLEKSIREIGRGR